MGHNSDSFGGTTEVSYDVDIGGKKQRWRYSESATDSVRVTELEDGDSGFDDPVPTLEDAESDRGTDPDARPRVAFSPTVPAPVEMPTSGTEKLLGDLRKQRYRLPEKGDVIAERYRVIRVIGEGGMSKVMEASHARLGKSFALKLLRPALSNDKEMRSAFFREAKYASSLVHKNLVSVLDFGEDPRFGVYMVMELAVGQLLSDYLQTRGRLSIKRSCDIILQVAEALSYIHNESLIHCDLKPQNIMLTDVEYEGRRSLEVKVLDFGLAQSRIQTNPDRVFGTPKYISPEAALGEPPTELSDIYSLGILFFELLAGHALFQGDPKTILRSHIRTLPPKLSEARGEEVDPALERLVATALSKYPERRQTSMSAFLYELKNFMQMSGIGRKRHNARVSTPAINQRSQLACSAFDALRLPLATIDREGVIVAANAAFSKFVMGMRVGIEGSNLFESSLASAWTTMADDISAACSGKSRGRRVEIDLSAGRQVRLQMWLEPTARSGFAVLSLYPER